MKHITLSPTDLPYRLVNYGVDTLILNVRYADDHGNPAHIELPECAIEKLDAWQALAKEKEEPVETWVNYLGTPFMMHHHGAGKGQWKWLLTNPLMNLSVSRGRLNGIIIQVRVSAQLLWSSSNPATGQQDLWTLIEHLSVCLNHFFATETNRLHFQVSEIHLCADLAGWDVEACYDWQATMLSRARRRVPRSSYTPVDLPVCQECQKLFGSAPQEGSFLWQGPEEETPTPIYSGHHLETIEFGTHGSPLSCVIYNKSREIKKKGKDWFKDIWKRHGYDNQGDIWRVEFRWKREALHEIKQEDVFHGIETIADLHAHLPYLWAYCAGHIQGGDDSLPDGWLRYVIPTDDKTVSRWPVHPAWGVVQSAFTTETEEAVNILTGEVVEVPVSPLAVLIRERQRQRNIQRLVQQIAGCSSTLAAHLIGRMADASVDLSADTVNDLVPIPEHLTDLDLPAVLAWLQQNAALYALKEKLRPGAPDDLRQQLYDEQFEASLAKKRVLYGLANIQQ